MPGTASPSDSGRGRRTSRRRAVVLSTAAAIAAVLAVVVVWSSATGPTRGPQPDATEPPDERTPSEAGGDGRAHPAPPPGNGAAAAAPRIEARRPGDVRATPDAGPPAGAVRVRLRAPWGSGADAVGRHVPSEGAPVGPMAFAVDDAGAVVVLDNVNHRLQVFPPDGPPRSVPLPDGTLHDVALRPEGGFALLDRTRDRSVTLLRSDGSLAAELALEGRGVAEPGGATGVFADEDGVWVEVAHGEQVRLADGAGAADEPRRVRTGRPQPGLDRTVTARVQRPDRVVLLAHAAGGGTDAVTLLAEVAFGLPVHHVVGLGFDAAGGLYLGVWLARFAATPPYAVVEERLEVVALSPQGAERSRVALPVRGRPEEQVRSLFVTPDGIVYHLSPTDDGIVVREVVP